MAILVPADYLLEYSMNSNIFMIFILFRIFVDVKMKKWILKVSVDIFFFYIFLTLSILQNLVPGLKCITGSGICACKYKNQES